MPFTRGAREVPNQTAELEHPGKWLPGDKVDWTLSGGDTMCSFTFQSDGRWQCVEPKHEPVSVRETNDRLANDLARITYLVPRGSGQDAPDLPPSLPDTSGWVRREPGDVIEAGTPYVYVGTDGASFSYNILDHDWNAIAPGAYWTPPPVEPAPWERISTDRDHPTLATLTFSEALVPDPKPMTAWWTWRDGNVWSLGIAGWTRVCVVRHVTHVELLHTYSPETHVPVERALIDEAALCLPVGVERAGYGRSARVLRDLAALADGAQSKGAES